MVIMARVADTTSVEKFPFFYRWKDLKLSNCCGDDMQSKHPILSLMQTLRRLPARAIFNFQVSWLET